VPQARVELVRWLLRYGGVTGARRRGAFARCMREMLRRKEKAMSGRKQERDGRAAASAR